MSQSDNTTNPTNLLNDPYIARLITLANQLSKLSGAIESIIEVEEATHDQAARIDALTALESWLDGIATRQEKRLQYIHTFSDGA